MALHRRIRRVVLENKAQYFGSIALIIFSTFTYTLTAQFAMNFERLANEFQAGSVQEDATFTTAEPIGDLPGLEAASNAAIEEGGSFDYTLADGRRLRIFSRNERVNLPAIVEGRPLGASGEILISPIFATTNGYAIGDELQILDRSFTIVGLMTLPNYIYPLQSETDMMPLPEFGIAVIGKQDFAALGRGSRFYAVAYRQADQNLRAQALQFRELLRSRGIEIVQWTDTEDNQRVSIVAAEVDILNLVSKAIPMAILVLASIMVGNVLWRAIRRDAPVIGALYALGYTRGELARHYLVYPLLIAGTGTAVGTMLGLFPVRAMASFMFSVFIIPLTDIAISPGIIAISLLLPILLLGFSSYVVIHKELRHSPVELMRGASMAAKVSWLERALRIEALSFATTFALREQLRSLSRLAFLLFGVAVATMLLLWGFALKGSMDFLLSSSLTGTYNFVYEYKFDTLRDEPLPAGVEPISAAFFLPEGAEGRDFYVTGVPADATMLTLADAFGARLPTDQVNITSPLARQLGAGQGDTATVVRKVDGRSFTLRIDGVAETYAGRFIFMPLTSYNAIFEMPEGSYTGAFSNILLDIPTSEPYSVVTMEEKIAGFETAMAPTEAMVGALAVLAFIIGVIVIYVVTSLIVEENKQTISLMKIFGYRKREINALVLNSSTVIVVVGYLLGIPLVLSGLGVLIRSMEETVGLTLPPAQISPPYLLVGLVVVLLSYEVSKRLCRRRVSAVSMSEALKAGTE